MNQRFSVALLFGWIAVALTPTPAVHAADASSADRVLTTNATLAGTVTNSATGRTLEGARVVLAGTGREALTDNTGTYRFDNIAPGNVVLSVSYTGLNTLDVPVQITSEGRNHRDVGLTADIYTMSKFVVSGEREGNAQAITLQRLSHGVKSVVSADAFGNLAGNPADLLSGLSGVEGVSSVGDMRQIRIRGMSSELSSITIDGNRAASAGSATGSRAFQFDTLGAATIGRMEVIKSPTPDMAGDSIGGAVNMVSKSAFDSSPEPLTSVAENRIAGERLLQLEFKSPAILLVAN